MNGSGQWRNEQREDVRVPQRRRAATKLLVTILGSGLLCVAATAQSSPQYLAAARPPEAIYTLRTQVEEVHVLFTASDRKNRPIANLTREQVSVSDESAR